jgi:DNA-binding CsgD family transcriptional regulator
MTTSAISTELWVSEHTVKFHLTNIYRKLGVQNRASAVRWALENGLVAA